MYSKYMGLRWSYGKYIQKLLFILIQQSHKLIIEHRRIVKVGRTRICASSTWTTFTSIKTKRFNFTTWRNGWTLIWKLVQEDAPKPKVSHVCLLITSEFDCLNLRNYCDMFDDVGFSEGQSECVLSDSNRGLSGHMIHSSGWTYYERKVYSIDCSTNRFECPSGKCINQTSVCDGRDDCGDRSDEIVCQSQLDFQIRLVGSNITSEGRVEVKGFNI